MKLFKNLSLSILSWFLHHANQHGKDAHFYKIKNRILAKYGKHICYEVQFIDGKKCYSCNGTGIYRSFSFGSQPCYNCTNGWYKKPCWNILALLKFGKYEFHQPFLRVYEDPQSKCKTFSGYVERNPTRLTGFAITVLFLIYEKGYLNRWWNTEAGWCWKSCWWKPSSWPINLIHIIKKGRRSIPAIKFKVWWNNLRLDLKLQKQPVYEQFEGDDLPF
jgi:hypothetical protein